MVVMGDMNPEWVVIQVFGVRFWGGMKRKCVMTTGEAL